MKIRNALFALVAVLMFSIPAVAQTSGGGADADAGTCLCFTDEAGGGLCGLSEFCSVLIECGPGDPACLAGFTCTVDTCCGATPVCSPNCPAGTTCTNPGVCPTFSACELPPTGACCDSANPAGSPLCTDDVSPGDCGAPLQFFEGETCATVQADGRCTAVPAVSEWGLIVLTLIGLVAGMIVFGRRRPATT